ncbi:hypothetical protein AAFF_G00345950 [Aldrovandia affinis]|uniref:Uncharacterized protein n=1 Tax=Aldrovandia affinis TaxID=143900 RepID=A0AAD7SJE5_9TELE|nr:hypothetical protein AAFF_G00345950 [Aldrovandia affinis]
MAPSWKVKMNRALVVLIRALAAVKCSAATRPRNGGGPSVPNRDYEPLNIATRDLGVYAVAGVNRTG